MKIALFLLFFLLQWGGQLAAGYRSEGGGILFLLLVYACFLMRGVLWLLILKTMRLTHCYALSSLSYLILPLLSHLLLNDPIRTRYLPAGLLIVAGVTLYGVGEQRRRTRG